MGILFGIAKIAWGLTKLTFKTARFAFKSSRKIAKGSWKAFLTGRKVGKSAVNVIRKSRGLTQRVTNRGTVPQIKDSTIFHKE